MTWEWDYAAEVLPVLLDGMRLTLIITVLASLIALSVGFLLAYVRVRKIPVVAPLAKVYIQVVRNTPLLVQIYLFFFALPQFGITLSPTTSGVIVLGMQAATYMSEVYRSGIEAVPREQWDACVALNLPRKRIWLRVVLPQAIPPIIPALGNSMNEMLKLTAYAAAIGVVELFGQGLRVAELSYRYVVPFTLVGVIYLVVSVTFTILIRRFELRSSRKQSAWAAA
ncbi:MAG: ectoine/hydroxyectoine ABC transporter permease subunit EhuD [Propionibacteriaceae bacterium]